MAAGGVWVVGVVGEHRGMAAGGACVVGGVGEHSGIVCVQFASELTRTSCFAVNTWGVSGETTMEHLGRAVPFEHGQGEDPVKPSVESVGSWWRIRNVLIVIGDAVGVLVLIGVIAALGSHGLDLNLFG